MIGGRAATAADDVDEARLRELTQERPGGLRLLVVFAERVGEAGVRVAGDERVRDLGARRVICYSYGVPGNWESRISRELAEYLDGVAGPREPVALISFVGRPAILAQLHKTHLVTPSLQATFSSTAPGARAYVVLDDVLAQRLKLTTPRPQGFRLVASKHYPGSFGTELLTYQRLPARTP